MVLQGDSASIMISCSPVTCVTQKFPPALPASKETVSRVEGSPVDILFPKCQRNMYKSGKMSDLDVSQKLGVPEI